MSKAIEGSDGNMIKTTKEEEHYKYLGMLECNEIKREEMKFSLTVLARG